MARSDSNSLQAFWVGLGSLASFSLAIVSSMILSRYLSKEDYGTYKQVMYVYNTLLAVFTLGLPKSFGYFLPRVSYPQGKTIVSHITLFLLVIGFFFSLILYFGAPVIASVLKNSQLTLALRIFSPVPLLLLPTLGVESVYAAYRKTKEAAMYTTLTRFFILLCVVLPVTIFELSYIYALYGFVISSFFSLILALYYKSRIFRGHKNESSQYGLKAILDYTLPLMFAGIWGLILSSADQFFISRYFGTVDFAEFSNGSMELPFVGMIVGASTTVLYPLFSKLSHGDNVDPKREILPLWISSYKKAAMLILPILFFCWFYAEEIMTLLYGDLYPNSSVYFRIRLCYNFFNLIAFTPFILAIGKTKLYSTVHLVAALVVVFLDILLVSLFEKVSPSFIVIVSTFIRILIVFCFLRTIARYFSISVYKLFPMEVLLKISLISIISLLIIKYCTSLILGAHTFVVVVASTFLFILFFFIGTRVLKLDYFPLIKPFLKKK